MRSSLRGLRHLNDIAGLAHEDGWRDYNEDKHERITRARGERMTQGYREGMARLPQSLKPYPLGRHHDARITNIERHGDVLKVTAFDEDLAMIVDWKYGLDWREVGMPFDLMFEGVLYVGWRKVRGDNRLVPTNAPRSFDRLEWKYDALYEPEGDTWKWALVYVDYARYSDESLLLVEARHVKVVERQREEWIAHFGGRDVDLFDRYHAVRGEVSLAHHPERLRDFGVPWPKRAVNSEA